MFGHQVGVWHHVGAAIVVVWHCIGPSTILLQPLVGRFHASDQGKIWISSQLQDTFGHQVGVWQHAGARIVDDWHWLGVYPQHISMS